MLVLAHLVARGFKVKLITDEKEGGLMRTCAGYYGVEVVTLETMGEFDRFICCHGRKIIPHQYLKGNYRKFVNIHPCLFKYRGKDPISRYIAKGDIRGSVESHYMVEEVDAGEVIVQEFFDTPVVKTHAEFYNIALPYYLKCLERTLKWLDDDDDIYGK